MRCANCETDNREGRRFCAECGQPLPVRCQSCGESNEPGEKFCGGCGAAIDQFKPSAERKPQAAAKIRFEPEASDESTPAGERKTVTALFADIKGSMELMEGLDPEDARAIIDPALKLMIDAVHRYDGYIVQSTGDGIFALFGAPVAREDHPQRALYAALRMQEDIRRYSERLRADKGVNLQVRMGANAGAVVVRSIRTGAADSEYTPIGHSTSLAARLQTLATPGSVAISETLRKLVEGYFAMKPLGPARIKGVSEPVNVYEVTGLGPLRTRLERSVRHGLSRFVGRQAELGQLSRALDLAVAGRGQIVGAIGEAGVGKSRLFHEFRSVAGTACLVLEAYSVSHGRSSAYLPVIELLRDYFRITPEDDDRQRREKVIGKVLALDRSFEEILPYLFALLGLTWGDDSMTQMDAKLKQRRTQDAIKRMLLRESANQPLILIFEDLHWIDSETQALLNAMVDALASAHILILVNYRPEYRHEWINKTCYAQVRLDPLGRENADELLAALLGGSVELAPLRRVIIERTEGNPLFIEEMVQALFEDGVLIRNGTVRVAKPLGNLKIPPTVEGILASRIDHLPARAKELVQTLSVIGKEFTLPLAREVTGAQEDVLVSMLSDLQTGEFIYEQPALPDIEYRFKHALTQQVAYHSMLAERRKVLHERIAQAIESLSAANIEDHVGQLAHHYSLSGNFDKALEYLYRSGQQALRSSAVAEGIEHFRAALKLIPRLPDDHERARRELAIQIALGPALMNTKGFAAPEVGQACVRALELCRAIGAVAELSLVLRELWEFHEVRGEYDVALKLAEQLLQMAESRNDPALRAAAHSALGDTFLWVGQFTASLDHSERAIALFGPAMPGSGAFAHGYDLGVTARCFGALALWHLGYPERALAMSRVAIACARELDHAFTLAAALMLSDWLTVMRGDGKPISDESEALTLMTEHGFAFFLAFQTILHGARLVDDGRRDEGIDAIHSGLEGIAATGAAQLPSFRTMLASAYAEAGRLPESLEELERTFAHLKLTNERFCEAELHRVRGEILEAQDRASEAEEAYREAIEISRRQSARSLELRVATSLAQLMDKQGRRDAARAMLASVYGWFTEGFETRDLRDARALLERLGG